MSDWLLRMPALHLAEAAHAGGARVWLYELCWGFDPYGASHGLDTLLVFGTAEIETGLTEAGPDAVAQAQRLSELLRAEHLAFASTGDPGWPPTGLTSASRACTTPSPPSPSIPRSAHAGSGVINGSVPWT